MTRLWCILCDECRDNYVAKDDTIRCIACSTELDKEDVQTVLDQGSGWKHLGGDGIDEPVVVTDDGETHYPQNFDFEAGEPKPPVVTGSGVAISTEFRYGRCDDEASVASAQAVTDQIERMPNLTNQQLDLVLKAVERAEMVARRAGDSELADSYAVAIEPLHYASEARR